MDTFDDWSLTLAVFLPAVGMAAVLLTPKKNEFAQKLITLVTTIVTLGVGIGILTRYNWDSAGATRCI